MALSEEEAYLEAIYEANERSWGKKTVFDHLREIASLRAGLFLPGMKNPVDADLFDTMALGDVGLGKVVETATHARKVIKLRKRVVTNNRDQTGG